ncbi:Sulfate-binding protein OS=Lysinibacillus sphaericus OX=1421 GN=LS41612_05405 PE=3 SV=1 [Lysinibacillus sphaericus]
MNKRKTIFQTIVLLSGLTIMLTGCNSTSKDNNTTSQDTQKTVELLNVSYDPTRELYDEFNQDF